MSRTPRFYNQLALQAIFVLLMTGSLFTFQSQAQEQHGSTLNLGLGVGGYGGYYGYLGRSLPVFHLNYEIDVADHFTLAPFVSVYTFSERYFWSNDFYRYRETVIPIGVKGTYYFDEILSADSNWDFYLGGSLGFALVNARWDDGYDGNRNVYRGGNPLFLDLHMGAEYHLNERLGVFLDLSTGVSMIGVALH